MIPPAFIRTFAPLLSVPLSLVLHYTNVVATVGSFSLVLLRSRCSLTG